MCSSAWRDVTPNPTDIAPAWSTMSGTGLASSGGVERKWRGKIRACIAEIRRSETAPWPEDMFWRLDVEQEMRGLARRDGDVCNSPRWHQSSDDAGPGMGAVSPRAAQDAGLPELPLSDRQ